MWGVVKGGRAPLHSPRRPRKIDGDVFSTRTINVNVKLREETNIIEEQMRRRSSVFHPLVQPSTVLLSCPPKESKSSVPIVLISRAKIAHDTLCPGARKVPPRTLLTRESEILGE